MICSMCEQEVKALPYKLIDTIPHHNGHTQDICKECADVVGGIDAFDKSDDIQKHPLKAVQKPWKEEKEFPNGRKEIIFHTYPKGIHKIRIKHYKNGKEIKEE